MLECFIVLLVVSPSVLHAQTISNITDVSGCVGLPVPINFMVTDLTDCEKKNYTIDVYHHNGGRQLTDLQVQENLIGPGDCNITLTVRVALINYDNGKFQVLVRNASAHIILTSNNFTMEVEGSPHPVTNVTLAVNCTGVYLNWSSPRTPPGCPIANYTLFIPELNMTNVTTSTNISYNVLPNGQYTISITASNSVATSNETENPFLIAIDPPDPVTDINSTVSCTGVYLNWSSPRTPPGCPILYYTLFIPELSMTNVTTSTNISYNVLPNRQYTINITASNGVATSNEAYTTFITAIGPSVTVVSYTISLIPHSSSVNASLNITAQVTDGNCPFSFPSQLSINISCTGVDHLYITVTNLSVTDGLIVQSVTVPIDLLYCTAELIWSNLYSYRQEHINRFNTTQLYYIQLFPVSNGLEYSCIYRQYSSLWGCGLRVNERSHSKISSSNSTKEEIADLCPGNVTVTTYYYTTSDNTSGHVIDHVTVSITGTECTTLPATASPSPATASPSPGAGTPSGISHTTIAIVASIVIVIAAVLVLVVLVVCVIFHKRKTRPHMTEGDVANPFTERIPLTAMSRTHDSVSPSIPVTPESPTPAVDPESPTPAVDPESPTPAVDSESPTPAVDPESPTPAVDPESPTPAVPESPTPAVPESPTPAVDPESPTPVVPVSSTPAVPVSPTPAVPESPTPAVHVSPTPAVPMPSILAPTENVFVPAVEETSPDNEKSLVTGRPAAASGGLAHSLNEKLTSIFNRTIFSREYHGRRHSYDDWIKEKADLSERRPRARSDLSALSKFPCKPRSSPGGEREKLLSISEGGTETEDTDIVLSHSNDWKKLHTL